MHPSHWFEYGICVYGQDTGVIAAGLMLLKMVDPDQQTPVPSAFGYKQPLHSALMGGGIVTAIFINVQAAVGIYGAAGICAGAMVVVVAIWFVSVRPTFEGMRDGVPIDDEAPRRGTFAEAPADHRTEDANASIYEDEPLMSVN